jgi:hypothetical protein
MYPSFRDPTSGSLYTVAAITFAPMNGPSFAGAADEDGAGVVVPADSADAVVATGSECTSVLGGGAR